jgi:hypothetical protein
MSDINFAQPGGREVYGRSIAGIVSSKSAEGLNVRPLCFLCLYPVSVMG